MVKKNHMHFFQKTLSEGVFRRKREKRLGNRKGQSWSRRNSTLDRLSISQTELFAGNSDCDSPDQESRNIGYITFTIVLAGCLIPGRCLAMSWMVGVAVADTRIPAVVVFTLLHFDFCQQ